LHRLLKQRNIGAIFGLVKRFSSTQSLHRHPLHVQAKALITAHRGASAYAPENTLAAVSLALQFRPDFIEIDVHLSRDHQVVLLHDESLDRTTNGSGKIWQQSLAELNHLDAGSWFSARFDSERIPTLKEVIQLVKGHVKLDIEVKSHPEQLGLVDHTLNVIAELDFEQQCIITSFDRDALAEVHSRNPNISIGLITSSGIPTNMYKEPYDYFMCAANIVDRELVAHIHQVGKKIHVWTVNRAANMRRFLRMGVDGIITNRPDVLREILFV